MRWSGENATPTILRWMLVSAVIAVAGCTREESNVYDELVRSRQREEAARMAKPKSLEEKLDDVRAYLNDGNAVAAEDVIQPLLIAEPDQPEIVVLAAKVKALSGDHAEAIALLDGLETGDEELRSETLWLSANWLLDAGDYQAAMGRFEQMLSLPGPMARVHRKLATIYNNLGRRVEAAPHLRALARLGEITEKELFAMNAYGVSFIDESAPAPQLGEDLTRSALVIAKQHHDQGKLDRARALAENLAAKFPESTAIAALLGQIYLDTKAQDDLERWIATTPPGIEREAQYWRVLGIYFQGERQHREAVRCLAEAVRRDPTDRFAYYSLGRSLKLLGEDELAECAIQRADWLEETNEIAKEIGKRPGTEQELDRMADLLEKLGRPLEAIQWRVIAVKRFRRTSGDLEALETRREALTRQEPDDVPERNALVCGMELANWPLPDLQSLIAKGDPRSRRASESETLAPLSLRDVAQTVGLDFQYDNGDDPSDNSRLIHQITGGGIGVIDFDLDGYGDVYLTQGGGEAFASDDSLPNRLFRNRGGRQWLDVTGPAATGDRGYGQGVAVTDMNQDGFPDLIVANIGPNVLFRNNGDGTFTRRELPVANPQGQWTTSIAGGDLSGDALPEIFEVNYIDDPKALETPCEPGSSACNPRSFRPARDYVWQLATDGTISQWDGCPQIASKAGYGFGVLMTNLDGQAGNDVFVANDTRYNHLWVSQRGDQNDPFKMVEAARLHGCGAGLAGQPRGCMGIAFGDFDRNHRLDLYVTNFMNEPADVYMQGASGLFVPARSERGLYRESTRMVGWGAQAVDLDRNGWMDLVVQNGHVTDRRTDGEPFQMRPQLFQANASGFELVEPSGSAPSYWSQPTLGRTVAVLDWNRDGRPDLVTNHLDFPVSLLQNETNTERSIEFQLVGITSERDAIGAEVTVRCDSEQWTRWVTAGDGFLCSNENVLDFGIGANTRVDHVKVRWPSGTEQTFQSLDASQRYLLVEDHAVAWPLDASR